MLLLLLLLNMETSMLVGNWASMWEGVLKSREIVCAKCVLDTHARACRKRRFVISNLGQEIHSRNVQKDR